MLICKAFSSRVVSVLHLDMELSVAKNLIENGVDQTLPNQVWADLGAGDGLFTNALADLLPSNSKIVSVDKDKRALKNISVQRSGIELQVIAADLNDLPKLSPLDGIVMANALHYIKTQKDFLLKLKMELLKKSGILILIEYDLDKSNPWVPYPISKHRLGSLSAESGFALEILANSVQSKLNSSEIYSALLKPEW